MLCGMGTGFSVVNKNEIIQAVWGYVHSCRVDDGGYFFARITPGSLLDSCYAVRILANTGASPEHVEDLKEFVRQHIESSSSSDIHAWYLASEILKQLDEMSDLRKMTAGLTPPPAETMWIVKPDSLYIEVSSELQHVFEYVSLLRNLRLNINEAELAGYVRSLRNDDGGYGLSRSSLATTYYAIKTLSLLNIPLENTRQTLEFLDSRESSVYFLEDLFYLVHASAALGKEDSASAGKISFVLDCQRGGGGFARAKIMGIPTLEYTYYAVSTLNHLGFLDKAREGGQIE